MFDADALGIGYELDLETALDVAPGKGLVGRFEFAGSACALTARPIGEAVVDGLSIGTSGRRFIGTIFATRESLSLHKPAVLVDPDPVAGCTVGCTVG